MTKEEIAENNRVVLDELLAAGLISEPVYTAEEQAEANRFAAHYQRSREWRPGDPIRFKDE